MMDSGVDLPHMKKKNKSKESSLDKELEEENSFLGFPEIQESGGHENAMERKTKQMKNKFLKAANTPDTELEAEKQHTNVDNEANAKTGKKKTKKHKDVNSGSWEEHEMEGRSQGEEKKKNIEASSERKARRDRGEFEEKTLEYHERENDTLEVKVTRNDGFQGEDIVEKKKRTSEEGFEDKHEKNARSEENYEESAKEKKKKKKRKREDSDEEDKISDEENLADDERIKYGAEEDAENPGSSTKYKSKENRSKKPKERKADSDKSSTDYRPLNEKRKKVTFSDQVEVCGAEEMKDKDNSVDRKNDARIADACDGGNLTWGRFTKEEDQKIRDSVAKYIKEQGFDEDEGLDMILNCQKYPKVRNCWKEIGCKLPWRSHRSVYNRAHVLYEQSEDHSWTKDEFEFVKSFQAEHGKKWNKLAKVLGKSRYHVKDTWRRIRRGEMNKGTMSQEEYQRLFDLVNYNLRLKASQMEEKPTHRKIRNNINWEAIADKMETRDHVFCCKKWYGSLTSSMVQSGQWHDGDDCILLRRLMETNAFDEEGVEWDDLMEDRSGEICRKRWKQMAKHLGEHPSKPFLQKLELLVRRYAPDLIE